MNPTTPFTRIFLVLALAVPATSEELISNGSFETGKDISPGYYTGVILPGTDLPGWNGNFTMWYDRTGAEGATAQDGARFVNMIYPTDTDVLEQTFDVLAGNVYTVSYYERQRAGGAYMNATLSVANGMVTGAAGTPVAVGAGPSTSIVQTTAAGNAVWTLHSFTFTPDTTTQATLSFGNNYIEGNHGDNDGVFLDMVSVTGTSTPRANVLSFGTNVAGSSTTIDHDAKTIAWTVPYGTAVTILSPTYTLSAGATCDKASGSTNDFTSPVAYTVISSDNAITNAHVATVTVGPIATLTLAAPQLRRIVQRGASNTADIVIIGTLTTAANMQKIEARAVVMAGSTNTGPTTAWTTISTVANGAFTGTLARVAAGGWYRLELRAVDAASNLLATASVYNVGVGDIFITAGQSNAGNFGSPAQTPTDDRVSAYAVAGNAWCWATDPQPNPSGWPGWGGGSPWPILGSILAQSNGVPVGMVAVAWGATDAAFWQPGGSAYANLRDALQAFGHHGVRAVLWHQGESDSLDTTTASAYFRLLTNIILQSRSDAGWSVPWGIAEATFHPSATRAQEEPVAAGQRMVAFTTTNCFRGPRTDDFNLQGKLSDTVHFNDAGLHDHARQWADALNGVENLTPLNGDFESNAALADGTADYATRVIGWNRLDSAGTAMAAGNNGYFNPGPSTYAHAADSTNGGVLANMSGRHAGTLSASAANNAFLQTLRAHLQSTTTYIVSVAFGVRDNGDTFGGYRVDLLANGMPLGDGVTGTVATLNALAGGSATGTFTPVTLVYRSGAVSTPGQQLAIRITKPGGNGTYLDFDNVQIATRTDLPFVTVTNIPGTTNVPITTTTFDIAGTNNGYVAGMWWTNARGGGGTVPFSTPDWTFIATVTTGANIITVYGSNAAGTVASDSATVNVVPEPAAAVLLCLSAVVRVGHSLRSRCVSRRRALTRRMVNG